MNYNGRTILSFESRRADLMENMIKKFNGNPVIAPTLKEVPIGEQASVFQFAEDVLAGKIDGIIFTTGVGTEHLFKSISLKYSLEEITKKISSLYVVVRGPKPVKVLRDHKVDIDIIAPEPNTWVEVLECLDKAKSDFDLKSKRIVVQEYGVSNPELINGLKDRGARVEQISVYRWELPDNIEPLKKAIASVIQGNIDMVLLTSAIQIKHALQVAERENKLEEFSSALKKSILCSVGPMCSKALTELGFKVNFEPSHPKQGHLVAESAKLADKLCSAN